MRLSDMGRKTSMKRGPLWFPIWRSSCRLHDFRQVSCIYFQHEIVHPFWSEDQYFGVCHISTQDVRLGDILVIDWMMEPTLYKVIGTQQEIESNLVEDFDGFDNQSFYALLQDHVALPLSYDKLLFDRIGLQKLELALSRQEKYWWHHYLIVAISVFDGDMSLDDLQTLAQELDSETGQ